MKELAAVFSDVNEHAATCAPPSRTADLCLQELLFLEVGGVLQLFFYDGITWCSTLNSSLCARQVGTKENTKT